MNFPAVSLPHPRAGSGAPDRKRVRKRYRNPWTQFAIGELVTEQVDRGVTGSLGERSALFALCRASARRTAGEVGREGEGEGEGATIGIVCSGKLKQNASGGQTERFSVQRARLRKRSDRDRIRKGVIARARGGLARRRIIQGRRLRSLLPYCRVAFNGTQLYIRISACRAGITCAQRGGSPPHPTGERRKEGNGRRGWK